MFSIFLFIVKLLVILQMFAFFLLHYFQILITLLVFEKTIISQSS